MISVALNLLAQATQPTIQFITPDHRLPLWQSLINVAAFAIVGIIITIFGFKLFDWAMPHIKVEKELCERNYAVAIVMAASILAVGAVIVAAIVG